MPCTLAGSGVNRVACRGPGRIANGRPGRMAPLCCVKRRTGMWVPRHVANPTPGPAAGDWIFAGGSSYLR